MSGIGETYECAQCHGVFQRVISDEEALAEMHEAWRDPSGPLDIVCDALLAAWAQLDHPEYLR